MQISETFFEDKYSSSGQTRVTTQTPQEFSDFFSRNIYCKEIELNSLTPTKVDFQTNLKGDSGSYQFLITAEQREIEQLVKLFYWSREMSWIPQHELIPKKGPKLRRVNTHEKKVITEVAHYRVTLCSPEGDLSEMDQATLLQEYELIP
jgi:hypothetical protein